MGRLARFRFRRRVAATEHEFITCRRSNYLPRFRGVWSQIPWLLGPYTIIFTCFNLRHRNSFHAFPETSDPSGIYRRLQYTCCFSHSHPAPCLNMCFFTAQLWIVGPFGHRGLVVYVALPEILQALLSGLRVHGEVQIIGSDSKSANPRDIPWVPVLYVVFPGSS